MRFHQKITRMPFGKMTDADKGETIHAQPEIKAHRHARAAIQKADTRLITVNGGNGAQPQ